MINRIEGSLVALSSALYFGSNGLQNSQYRLLTKGLSQITLGGALALRGNRIQANTVAKTALLGLGLGSIALGVWNTSLGLYGIAAPALEWEPPIHPGVNESSIPPYSLSPKIPDPNQWQISVTKDLNRLELFHKYPVSKEVELPSSDYAAVGWNHFKIHSVAEKKLYTRQLGPCIALGTRGYDIEGKLTHTGLAHYFTDPNTATDFLKSFREKVKGRIELFIAGGDDSSDYFLKGVKRLANATNIKILDDVSKQFFKDFALFYNTMMYRGSSGIAQIYFDKRFNLKLEAGLLFTGLENVAEALSDPSTIVRQYKY